MSNIVWYDLNMTSNSVPSPLVASASSEYSTTLMAWKAFNGTNLDVNDCWANTTSDSSPFLQIDYGSSMLFNSVMISARNLDTTNASPKKFKITASNNNTSWVTLGEFETDAWEKSESKIFVFDNKTLFRYYRIDLVSNFISEASKHFIIANLVFGSSIKRIIIKNPLTNQHYSLAEKTLIPLPDASSKNMILHGIEAGKEIQLDEAFDKIQYINELSTATQGTSGKIVTQPLMKPINKILKISEVKS